MPKTALTLWITELSCKCGNRWTHSHCTYPFGGTPTPTDMYKLQPMNILHSRQSESHCFRCVPLGLNIGWIRCDEVAPRTAIAAAESDLLA